MTLEQQREAQLAQQENTVIAGTGLRAMLETYLARLDIDNAKKMFACHHAEAMEAIKYHNPEQHEIMSRADKFLQGDEVYETAKITRNVCEVANNTGTFFMFGNPLTITLANDPDEAKELNDAFGIFKDFLEEVYFNERMYEARETTGSETECAKIYDLYTDEDNVPHISCRVHKNSNNEKLYPMFNQHGQLVAFALGYFLRSNDINNNNALEEHFDVWTTRDILYFCRKDSLSKWEIINRRENPFGKIPVMYYNHEVDWKGSERTIDRMEWVLSKHADTVDYFGDPYLVVSQDIVNNRLAGARDIGKVIVSDDVEKSQFEFVAPPDGGDLVKNHMSELKEDFLIDTMNPDLSYKSIMGLGTLSGEAMRRIYVPGYIKRVKFAVKIYNEMIRREFNLIKAILINYRYSGQEIASKIARLKLHFDYTDPFIGGIEDNTEQIESLTAQKVMSRYAAVQANRFVTDKEAEYERLWEEDERRMMMEAKVQALVVAQTAASQQQNNQTNEED